ncbi:MAG: hypothetical protein QUS14_09175, partial [Pyrinomonadaceae bacterium]|nr:hypothetical protein [Pyrinomonadaceae bacterium]
MKRFISAVVLCVSLLAVGFWTMSRTVAAEGDIILALLELPAPPPPNPWVPAVAGSRPEEFYDPSKQPPDDAPIEDLIEYWERHSPRYSALNFNIKPSETVMRRLASEVERDPASLARLINVFVESEDGARIVKNIYDRLPAEGEDGMDIRRGVQQWLTYNSPYFTDRLERTARRVGDSDEYVSNQQDLLSLSRYDWQRAEPIVNRLYNDSSQPVSRVLAMWALYRRALDTDSLGDTDRYRGELMAVVEDRNATAGMRDLAFDALVKEKEWSGRDEWYYTLLADETLAELRVNGQTYTGLTTLILNQPKEKYRAKMLELAASQNKTVRSAAVRNLLIIGQEKGGEDIVKALLPWLTNANWVEVADDERGRSTIIGWLAQYKVPEAVPGLIALLDEKDVIEPLPPYRPGTNSNTNSTTTMSNVAIDDSAFYQTYPANAAANAARPVARAANMIANAANTTAYASNRAYGSEIAYPHRQQAISALAFQKDPRAIPPLRRLLGQVSEQWERGNLIKAIV